MRKLRKQAKELLHMASKVYHYRKDVIPAKQLEELEKAVQAVESIRTDKTAKPDAFEAAMETLDKHLRTIGGKIYPKTFWSDNLEVLLVAAILVIGVRTFFFQPFIIPTNSMYPTYNGMTFKIYAEGDTSPDQLPQRIFNKITLGAKHKRLTAKNEGPLLIPIGRNLEGGLFFLREQVPGRKWLFFPTVLNEYTFYVGDQAHTLRVPGEFDMSPVLLEAFGFGDDAKMISSSGSHTGIALDTGRYLKAGDPIIRFDINLGDALFVDRISYHFKRPKVGDPFVFRTREIEDLDDKYYIKRLAGVGGETLEIRDGALFADGELRDEADAFVLNAEKSGEYEGYVNIGLLAEGRKLTVPENSFVALGDNSDNSKDSRSWGFVPDKSVTGKAIFIYYPFTSHWGLAE